MTTVSRWCTRFSYVQWRKNCPCRPYNAGGPARVGGPCANPQKNYFHDIVVCTVVLMDATQFTSNCSIAGRGALWPCFAAFAGGPRICSYATAYVWIYCISVVDIVQFICIYYLYHTGLSSDRRWKTTKGQCIPNNIYTALHAIHVMN